MNTIIKNIIQIIPSFAGHGADNLAVELHQLFLQKKMDARIISFKYDSTSEIPNIFSLRTEKYYNPKIIFLLSQKLKKILKYSSGPIILHAHLTPCQLWLPIAAKLTRLKMILVTTEHSVSNRRRNIFLGKYFDHKLFKPYERIICISKAVQEAMSVWQPDFKDKLITIFNGIDLNKFYKSTSYHHNSRIPALISVGRLQPVKNYEAGIRACSLLKDLAFMYYILGSGPDEGKLNQLVTELGLTKKVKLLGYQPDVIEYLSRSDIFLMPSLWEGFGLAAQEAMAIGLPTVVSDVPGVRDLVGNDEKVGFLIDPQNPIDIAEKLRRLLLDPKLRLSMGKQAMLRARRYSIETTADRYIELYDKLLSENYQRK